MAGTTTAFPTSFKQELAQGMHCFTGSQTPTGNTTNTSTGVTSLSSPANLCRGMAISGTGIPANTFIADLPTSTTLTLSQAATATNSGTTLTCAGDTFNVALIKNGCAGTYGAASTNYSNITGNSDEATGAGYTAGGQTLTANTTPATSGTTAFWSWSTNPSWASATLDVQGCMFYNNSTRAGAAGRAVYVGDFGGEQKVTAGTLTLVLPTNNSSSAILRIN
ncbi:MAG TPA: hypothetical protein VFA12_20235 [Stellaceae bacterium]|nr:hypothetical protein [Stellaceae bacterium]